MTYYELRLVTDKTQVDVVSHALESELQALSITWQDAGDQAIFEPELETTPLWQEVHIKAIYDGLKQAEHAKNHLESAFKGLMVELVSLADTQWETAWHQYFQPIQITPYFWIVPTGLEPPTDPKAQWINLSPGLAFGTGTHPTTHLCLAWLTQQDLDGKTVIDYGCGSGILTLAALQLGAKHVYAVDIDPQALEATHNNREQNGFATSTVTTFLPHEVPKDLQADVLVANILLTPLLELKNMLLSFIEPTAPVALSGIMQAQWDTLNHAYQNQKSGIRQDKDGWSLWSRF